MDRPSENNCRLIRHSYTKHFDMSFINICTINIKVSCNVKATNYENESCPEEISPTRGRSHLPGGDLACPEEISPARGRSAIALTPLQKLARKCREKNVEIY